MDDQRHVVSETRRIVLTPSGSVPSDLARRESVEIAEFHAQRLDRARKGAEGWAAGQATMLGLLGTVAVVKGPDTIDGLSPPMQALVAACLLAALCAGVAGVVLFTSAAFGSLRDQALTGPPGLRLERWRQQELTDLRRRLKGGLLCTYLLLALVVTAVGTSWFGAR